MTRITPAGQRVTAVLLDAGVELFACRDLARSVAVSVRRAGQPEVTAAVARAYTRASGSLGEPESGRYLVIELAGRDEELVQPYALESGNTAATLFREYAADGTVVQRSRVQAISVPRYLDAGLVFQVTLTGGLVRADGGFLAPRGWDVAAAPKALLTPDLDGFEEGVVRGAGEGNELRYRFRRPVAKKGPAPLVVFLHGSGQMGQDNLAHVLSSLGAVGVLGFEDAYVLAPQLPSVFDPADPYDEAAGTGGGIHWQSRNRRRLIAGLVRRLLREEPGIDAQRVYIQGLSRGGEGALALVLDEPGLFAAGLVCSGREAGTVEWMDGHAAPDLLRPALGTPLWFFHAVPDTVSPVTGTRRNVEILRGLGHPALRYTELIRERSADSGYVNASAHNSWDVAYNSPDVWSWLLDQRRPARG